MSLKEDTECTHSKIIEDEGDRICSGCGQLLENIDFRAEWKGYGDNANSRCRFVVSTVSKNGIEEIIEKSKLELSFAQKKEIEQLYIYKDNCENTKKWLEKKPFEEIQKDLSLRHVFYSLSKKIRWWTKMIFEKDFL